MKGCVKCGIGALSVYVWPLVFWMGSALSDGWVNWQTVKSVALFAIMHCGRAETAGAPGVPRGGRRYRWLYWGWVGRSRHGL